MRSVCVDMHEYHKVVNNEGPMYYINAILHWQWRYSYDEISVVYMCGRVYTWSLAGHQFSIVIYPAWLHVEHVLSISMHIWTSVPFIRLAAWVFIYKRSKRFMEKTKNDATRGQLPGHTSCAVHFIGITYMQGWHTACHAAMHAWDVSACVSSGDVPALDCRCEHRGECWSGNGH